MSSSSETPVVMRKARAAFSRSASVISGAAVGAGRVGDGAEAVGLGTGAGGATD